MRSWEPKRALKCPLQWRERAVFSPLPFIKSVYATGRRWGTAGLCSAPLWIQNINKEFSNKNSLCLIQRRTNCSLGQVKWKKFLKVHPYGNCWMKPESFHSIMLPWKCNMQRGLLTFKLWAMSWSSCYPEFYGQQPIGTGWQVLGMGWTLSYSLPDLLVGSVPFFLNTSSW